MVLMPWFAKLFKNRNDAGRQLAKELFRFVDVNPIILALPRGGIPIGYEIAKLCHAPLDVLVVRKVGLPDRPEFGVGAIAEGNVQLFDERTLKRLGISPSDLKGVINAETKELNRRVQTYREKSEPPSVKGRTVILIDDGLATGVTARAAIEAIKKLHPKKIVFASPICAYDSTQELNSLVDEVICLATPLDFMSVGQWYQNFEQLEDEEVVDILKKAKQFLPKHATSNVNKTGVHMKV